MNRLIPALIALLLATPLAVAAGNEALPDASGAPTDPLAPVAAAASAAGDAVASAASATAGAATTAAKAVGAAFAALGHALAGAAAAIGAAFVALGHGLATASKAIGSAIAAAANLALTLGALLGSLFVSGARTAAAHPKETAIITSSAATATSLLWILKRFGLLAGIPLYTRLAPGEILDNEARSNLYTHIREHPGKHVSALAADLHLGWGTITYHLARLENNKLVTPKSVSGRKCYFAIGTDLNADDRTAIATLNSDPARRIIDAVRNAPGITQKDLAQTLGISQALASWHIKRLTTTGVLQTTRQGRSNTLTLPQHVNALA